MSSFGHVTSYGLPHCKQMVRVRKTKSLLFCLRDDPPIVFGRQNRATFIFIKTMSHDLLVQVAYNVNVNEKLGISSQLPKDVCANCFCASLLCTQIHMPRHA